MAVFDMPRIPLDFRKLQLWYQSYGPRVGNLSTSPWQQTNCHMQDDENFVQICRIGCYYNGRVAVTRSCLSRSPMENPSRAAQRYLRADRRPTAAFRSSHFFLNVGLGPFNSLAASLRLVQTSAARCVLPSDLQVVHCATHAASVGSSWN